MDITRRNWLAGASATSAAQALPKGLFDVRDYKAKGDGKTINTAAIQAAIDACSAAGGGRVVFTEGNYVTGTLYIKSHVILYIDLGARLLGSPNIADYTTDTFHNMYDGEPHMDRCLIFARDAQGIGLEGPGIIDGQGKSFPNAGDLKKRRPMMIRFLNCQTVSLRQVTLLSPAAWTSAFLYSSDIQVDGVTVTSRANINGDGMDFDGCQNIRISNCQFDNSDDSICLQGSDPAHPVRNVVITNCIMTSRWAALRIGLLSQASFDNITVSNCVFHDHNGEAIKIQMTEGGSMSNLLFSNIVMREVARPVLITFNSFPLRIESPNPMPPMQSLKNIMFSHIRIESSKAANGPAVSFIAVSGLPDHVIENVSFDDIHFTAPGGGTHDHAARRVVDEFTDVRPESRVFQGALPTYGLYARHVKGLSLRNVRFDTAEQDLRPAIVCDDVEGAVFSGVRAGCDPATEHLIRLQNTRDVLFEGCAPTTPCAAFVRVEGAQSHDIALTGNDLRKSVKTVDRATDVPSDATRAEFNLEAKR